jgi:cytochrome c-type biogenesis protein CcmH
MHLDTPASRGLRQAGLGLALGLGLAFAALRMACAAPPAAVEAASATATPGTLAPPLAADPALEARVMAVAEELRCLVCQNETIAASQAELAQDLRRQIRLKLQQGQSPQEIMDFMVARYGDFVRYRPAFNRLTLLLWVGPFALLLAAAASLAWVIRRRRQTPAQALSDADRARARALLAAGPTASRADLPSSDPAPAAPSP